MSKPATDPDWVPPSVDMAKAKSLGHHIINQVKAAGYTREEFACALVMTAEAMTALSDDDALDADVCRFMAERFLAVSIAHSGGKQ